MALNSLSRALSSSFISTLRRNYIHAAATISSFFASSKNTTVRDITEASPAIHNAGVQFAVFYRFPYITAARFISRLKLYQTAVVVLAVPPAIYYYNIGEINLESCVGVTAVSTLALVMLYVAANFFQRVVGLVALSNDEKLVRFSHLTFFGGRRDIVVPVSDVVPLSDLDEHCNDVFVKVRRYSTSDTLYMSLMYGQVEHAETFQKVFGIIT